MQVLYLIQITTMLEIEMIGRALQVLFLLWDLEQFHGFQKKKIVVSLSTIEVEYIVVALCVCHCVWFRRILEQLGAVERGCSEIHYDNNSTIQLSKNSFFHGQCKHIGVRFHFLKDLVNDGTMKLRFCSSEK